LKIPNVPGNDLFLGMGTKCQHDKTKDKK
jgi:hypothetical protein